MLPLQQFILCSPDKKVEYNTSIFYSLSHYSGHIWFSGTEFQTKSRRDKFNYVNLTLWNKPTVLLLRFRARTFSITMKSSPARPILMFGIFEEASRRHLCQYCKFLVWRLFMCYDINRNRGLVQLGLSQYSRYFRTFRQITSLCSNVRHNKYASKICSVFHNENENKNISNVILICVNFSIWFCIICLK